MSVWWLLALIVGLGAIGGAVNALISDNGFFLPTKEKIGEAEIWRPGAGANIVIGAVGSATFWMIYGPFAGYNVAQTAAAAASSDPAAAAAVGSTPTQTLAGLATSLIIGVGGSRFLTAEVDKRLLRATAVTAATNEADPGAAAGIAGSSPATALRIASQA